jgi:hypothetical protein
MEEWARRADSGDPGPVPPAEYSPEAVEVSPRRPNPPGSYALLEVPMPPSLDRRINWRLKRQQVILW